jgi:pimeloyl-ACP methyl ester carboxylesterase
MSRRHFLKTFAATTGTALIGSRIQAEETPGPCAFNFIYHDLCFVRLPCGRRLAYSEVGDANATWFVINHHGLMSGRIDSRNFIAPLRYVPGVRLITPDRPGVGESDADPDCTFLTWPNYVAALIAALGIETFSLSAISDGAPFALAVARAMPECAAVVSLTSPVCPLEFFDSKCSLPQWGARAAVDHPLLMRLVIRKYADGYLHHPERGALHHALKHPINYLFPSAEQRAGTRDNAEHAANAVQQGTGAVVNYLRELGGPWQRWLPEVPTKVKIMHGTSDSFMPLSAIVRLAAALPNAELRLYPNETHGSMGQKYTADRLFAALPPI